ncbi:MAG: phosphoribosylanthranilate isomerase [Alphaproteobacteria bacterium]
MRTRVKICCISSVAEAQLAIASGADALGFVAVQPPSPRTISDTLIATIAATVPPPVATFLLTARSTADAIADHVAITHPTTVQIASYIAPSELARLAELLPATRRVQVIHVEGPEVLDLIPRYAPHVHAFLLDSGRPSADVPEYGGTGQTHDWSVSAAFVRASPLPVFLAGGLRPDNVEEAIRLVKPFGVDLCSGVRTGGKLDADKLNTFMSAVRTADQNK